MVLKQFSSSNSLDCYNSPGSVARNPRGVQRWHIKQCGPSRDGSTQLCVACSTIPLTTSSMLLCSGSNSEMLSVHNLYHQQTAGGSIRSGHSQRELQQAIPAM